MIPREYNFNAAEVVIIDKQIENFLQTGVIETTSHCKGEYISKIFIRPKKDGSYRLILNLKNLNQFVQYHHFKMENLKSAITLMSPNCYMASIDLKEIIGIIGSISALYGETSCFSLLVSPMG